MKKKNISSTYMKKVSVQNVIEDMDSEQVHAQSAAAKPISAGGRSEMGMPPTLGQEHLQFVDGTDEVPLHLQPDVWALTTRMNQLTYIDGDFDFERMQAGVRAQLRPLQWKRKLTVADVNGIEYYVGVQLRKSKLGIERKYIVPGYQAITHQEIGGANTVIDERQAGFAAQGMLAKMTGGGNGIRQRGR